LSFDLKGRGGIHEYIGIASPSFSVWCGFFVNPDLPILLVVEYESEAERAQLELARIDLDRVAGYITADNLSETLQITQIGARDLLAAMESGWLQGGNGKVFLRYQRCRPRRFSIITINTILTIIRFGRVDSSSLRIGISAAGN
jgi:hypothetical protein